MNEVRVGCSGWNYDSWRAPLVIADHPERPFQTHELTATWADVRLHYGSRGRRGNYSEGELEQWARRLDEWRRERELLVYLNNDREAFAPRDALLLRRRLTHDALAR